MMSDADKTQSARDSRDASFESGMKNQVRSSTVADEFIRLEVQIATILFAFTSLFLNHFNSQILNFPPTGIFLMKIAFSVSLFLLIASFACGLLYLKCSERFYDTMLHQKMIRFNKWNEVVRGKSSFEEGLAYEQGTALEKGPLVVFPNWTWVLQTICLGTAVTLLFILAIIFLFNQV